MSDDTYSGTIATLAGRAAVNGQADPGDARGKRVANRSPWLDLPEPYDNLKIRVWLDYPAEVTQLLTPVKDETPEQTSARGLEFLKAVILQHDGWELDDDQGPLPQPDTDEFWDRIPNDLGVKIGERFREEMESGNSRGSRRAKRKNWKRR